MNTNPNHTYETRRSLRMAWAVRGLTLSLLAAFVAIGAGCHSKSPEKQNKDFFTSGSREADQRASQTMAKSEQLAGSGEGAGEREKGAVGNNSGTNGAAVAKGKESLFERLGGDAGITALVEDFLPRAMQDPRVNWDRNGVKRGGFGFTSSESVTWKATPQNVATLKKHLVEFLELATGGPSHYEGRDMKSAHAGMRISNPEFDAVVGDLKVSLDRLKIANTEQKELLAILESTRPEIVTQR
ncbi:MAG TPA: group 1 truncated hemoglobin [Verrucomicrobiae bacterium]|nr:group 1 truncated hemoglobin [Verrucomicrobiae bacterium]